MPGKIRHMSNRYFEVSPMDEMTDPTHNRPRAPRTDGATEPAPQGDPSRRENGIENAVEASGGPGSRSPRPPPQSDPPSIGRYRVIKRLGQGGFGRVHLARDDELDRPVAIKVPNPERILSPEDVEQFIAEAQALARLEHPDIVSVYDVGRTDDGLWFVVSQYIEG